MWTIIFLFNDMILIFISCIYCRQQIEILGRVMCYVEHLKNSNHRTLVYIDLRKKELVYIDPYGGQSEQDVETKFVKNWQDWANLWNEITKNNIPINLKLWIIPHAKLKDDSNHGIFTMCVSIIVYINLIGMSKRSMFYVIKLVV